MLWKLNNFAQNTALITEKGQKISYSELDCLCADFKTFLHERSLVFHLCKNNLGAIVGYLSFLNNKVVPLLLNANINEDLLVELLEVYRPEFIYIPEEEIERLQKLLIDFKILYKENDYVYIKTKYNDKTGLYDELALLLNTSGSTGSAKLVRLTYDNIKANTESIIEYLQLDSSQRAITNLAMSYTYALSIINTHLYVGASLVLTDRSLFEKEFWTAMQEYEVTSLAGVPYTYEMLDRLNIYEMNLPHLSSLTQAGGRIIPALHEKLARWAIDTKRKFIVMYGQTEACSRMGYLPFERSLEKFGKMGIAIPRGKFFLVDEGNNQIFETDKVGELVYEGANVSLGYAEKREDLLKKDENKGILYTGDMASFDNDGFYTIVGRKKRFLKLFGHRVNLDEVERAIRTNLELDCACAGYDDNLYVFTTMASRKKEIKDFVHNYTKIHFSAFKIQELDKLPINDSGKINYNALSVYYRK